VPQEAAAIAGDVLGRLSFIEPGRRDQGNAGPVIESEAFERSGPLVDLDHGGSQRFGSGYRQPQGKRCRTCSAAMKRTFPGHLPAISIQIPEHAHGYLRRAIEQDKVIAASAELGGGYSMFKKIEAIIREKALGKVREALVDIGIVGMTVFEVRGRGRHGDQEHSAIYAYRHGDMLPKIQLNIILSEQNVEPTIEAIVKAARTEEEGDGIIFVYPVEDVIRVRTGERGKAALSYPDDIDARRAAATR
jgi:nitrogen regulatory protein P-II 1